MAGTATGSNNELLKGKQSLLLCQETCSKALAFSLGSTLDTTCTWWLRKSLRCHTNRGNCHSMQPSVFVRHLGLSAFFGLAPKTHKEFILSVSLCVQIFCAQEETNKLSFPIQAECRRCHGASVGAKVVCWDFWHPGTSVGTAKK